MKKKPFPLLVLGSICVMAAASTLPATPEGTPAAPAIPAPPAASGASAKPLEAGDVAPDFALAGSDGKTHRLADFKGKRAVVVAWFPKAFTGG